MPITRMAPPQMTEYLRLHCVAFLLQLWYESPWLCSHFPEFVKLRTRMFLPSPCGMSPCVNRAYVCEQ